jgi:hypothetical protein
VVSRPDLSAQKESAYNIGGVLFWGLYKGTVVSAVYSRGEIGSLTIIHKRRSLGKLLGGRGESIS